MFVLFESQKKILRSYTALEGSCKMAFRRQEILPQPSYLHMWILTRDLLPKLKTLAPCPATQIYCPHQPLTASHSPVNLHYEKSMEFIEDFLALKPDEMFQKTEAEVAFKSSSNTPPYVTLIILASIFAGVLILMGLFLHVCKSRAEQPKETPVTEQITVL